MAIQASPIILKVFCVLFLVVFIDLITLINSFFFFFLMLFMSMCMCMRETGGDRER